MERSEALVELGLDTTATKEHIEAAWRSAIKVVHPEGTRPDPEAARRLNEAREVAIAGLAKDLGGALISLSDVMDLLVRSQSLQPAAAQTRAEQTLNRG